MSKVDGGGEREEGGEEADEVSDEEQERATMVMEEVERADERESAALVTGVTLEREQRT